MASVERMIIKLGLGIPYRAVSVRRSHNTRSHTGFADVDVK